MITSGIDMILYQHHFGNQRIAAAAQNNNVYGLIIIQEHPNRPGQERSVTRKLWGGMDCQKFIK